MKTEHKIRMGSSVFFDSFDDFKSKDTDYLCLVSDYVGCDKAMRVNIKGDDLVLYREDFTKDDFINEALTYNVPMKIGKFLVPEFIEYYSVTLDDLKKLKSLVDKLDEKHQYEKIIYDSYINNGKFELTEEQRKDAYRDYKKARELE